MGYAASRKTQGRVWRVNSSRVRKAMIFNPSLKRAGLETCWDCHQRMRNQHHIEDEEVKKRISKIYRRHRYLTQKGYRMEFVRYDHVWLDLYFQPWLKFVDYLNINPDCRSLTGSSDMWLHFHEHSKVPYIKTPHRDILFHMICDHVSEVRNGDIFASDLDSNDYISRVQEMLKMSSEDLEMTMAMEGLVL